MEPVVFQDPASSPFTPKPYPIMKKANPQVQEIKKQVLEAQVQIDKLQLKNTALETIINIAQKWPYPVKVDG